MDYWTQSAPTSNSDVVPDVTTSATTSATSEEKEDSVIQEKDVVIVGHDIPSKIQKDHPTSQVIGSIHGDMLTRRKDKVDYRKMVEMVCMNSVFAQVSYSCLMSLLEPKKVYEALKDDFWINSMHEELDQFVRNDV